MFRYYKILYNSYIIRKDIKKGLQFLANPCGCYKIRTYDFYPVKVNIWHLSSLLLNVQHKYKNKFINKYKGLQVLSEL